MTTPVPPTSVRPGELLAGKYRVEQVIGSGGMSVVVAAHHIQLDEKVALKFLLPHALQSPEAVARFIREARAAVKIKGEHVARVSDVGQLENGAPYLVMEYLEGADLAALLEQRGAMPIDQAVEFVLQACVAVADAHALGIVHRDLKPANLFCVRRSDGQLVIKVLDFGISKMTSPVGPGSNVAMTATSAMMGTPLYMSPEQMLSSKDVDMRTDIWALGAILYELISGNPPFPGQTVTEIAIKVANQPPAPLRGLRAPVPPGLEAIILKCLEKDRAIRYRNVWELSLALMPFASKRARTYVERISGIIHGAGLAESDIAPPASPQHLETPLSGAIGGATVPPVGRTTSFTVPKVKATVAVRGALAVLAVGGAIGAFSFLRKASVPHDQPQATASQQATLTSSVATAQVELPKTIASKLPEPTSSELGSPARASPPTHTSTATHGEPLPFGRPPVVVNILPQASSSAAPLPSSTARATTQASSPSSKPTVNCDPPYYFDARGNRIFKPECM